MRNVITSKIIGAGLVVGILDISAALIRYSINTGKNPMTVPKFIASAVFGMDAFKGGNMMIFQGFLFHFIVAMLFTIFFFILYRNIPVLSFNAILTGVVYGIFIWCVMNLVVVPLSSAPPLPFSYKNMVIDMLILIGCIGIPLALMARNWYKR